MVHHFVCTQVLLISNYTVARTQVSSLCVHRPQNGWTRQRGSSGHAHGPTTPHGGLSRSAYMWYIPLGKPGQGTRAVEVYGRFISNLAYFGIELKSNLTEWQSSINSLSCVRVDKGGRRMEDRLHSESVSKM